MEREYRRLRYAVERDAWRDGHKLESVIVQHAIEVVDSGPPGPGINPIPFSDRLAKIHANWSSILAQKTRTYNSDDEDNDSARRFRRVIEQMVANFITYNGTERDCLLQFFGALYLPSAAREAHDMCRKFVIYTTALNRLRETPPRERGVTEGWYTNAMAALYAASELGAWMDRTL